MIKIGNQTIADMYIWQYMQVLCRILGKMGLFSVVLVGKNRPTYYYQQGYFCSYLA